MGSADTSKLVSYKKELDGITSEYEKQRKELLKVQENIDIYNKVRPDLKGTSPLEPRAQEIRANLKELDIKTANLGAKVSNGLKEGTSSLFSMLEQGIVLASQKGGHSFMDAVASAMGNLPGAAKIQAQGQLADIGYQQKMLDINLQMLRYQASMALSLEKQVANVELDKAGTSDARRQAALNKLADIDTREKAIRTSSTSTGVMRAAAGLEGQAKIDLIKFAQALSGIEGQMRTLKDQAAAIVFNTALKELKAMQEVSQNEASNIKQKFDTEKQIYDLRVKNLPYL
jgi:hypothetical protein